MSAVVGRGSIAFEITIRRVSKRILPCLLRDFLRSPCDSRGRLFHRGQRDVYTGRHQTHHVPGPGDQILLRSDPQR